MRFVKAYALLGLYLFFLGNVQATSSQIQTHVHFLCSDTLEGRLTGSKGEKMATDYVATIFRQLGFEPAGDNGTFFQEFNFTAGILLGKNNSLSIKNQHGVTKHLLLDQDWRPLAFSDNTSFNVTDLIFVGYGITTPTYDSYKNLNVKNKWVVVLRHKRRLNQYSSLRYKTFNAKIHGAKGIIFVSKSLVPLASIISLSNSGIVALSLKSNVIDKLALKNIKLTGQTDLQKNLQHGRNVLAKLKIDLNNSTPMLIIGAHIDHLGHGELGGSRARENETGMAHPGADDNASGVASMLEAATQLSDLKTQGKLKGNKTIIFAAWSGEEFGVLGSSHFVTHLHPTIATAINLDMVGHLRKNLILQGAGSSPDWPKIIKKISITHPIALITQNDPYLPTDSTVFYLHGIPTLNFFTGAHDDYHSPRDKPETLNYAGIKSISDFLVGLIVTLEEEPNAIAYQAVPQTHSKPTREFKIYLGTIPDYSSTDIAGVKLSGVEKNSPSAEAGVKQDDVIIKLAGKNIHDIYDYTFVLSALPAGKPAKMIVLRGETKLALSVIARYRE